jgi:hypothetical protein
MRPLLTCLLVVPLASVAQADELLQKAPSKAELNAAFAEAMRQSSKRTRPDPVAVVPRLVELYREIDRAECLSGTERQRLRLRVESRLVELRNNLIRDDLADRRKTAPRPGSNGGGPNPAVVELVTLIQTTIEPQSWQPNGPGTLSYYSRGQALVVRQTGEVHHQLGGVLGALRK